MTYKDTSGEDPVQKIVSSDVVTAPVAHAAGVRYLVIDNEDADAEDDTDAGSTLKGSYSWKIFGSPTVPQTSSMDVTGTIYTLEASNQNFYGLNCHDVGTSTPRTVYDNTEGENWVEFINFLEGSKDTDIKVFGVMTHPGGIGDGKVDAYGNVGGYDTGTSNHKERPDTAVGKYAMAAAELSLLSVTYPNLIGFTIDDFPAPSLMPSRADHIYTREQVAIIQGGAETHNENFEFWPTHYTGHALRTAIPSNRIGFTYGFPTTASEFVSAEHTFRIPRGVNVRSAVLKFVYDDDYQAKAADGSHNSGDGNYIGYAAPDIFRGVRLNGTLIHQEDVSYDKRLQIFESDVTSNLIQGTNALKFTLSASSTTNLYKDRVFSYGDIQLEVEYTLKGSSAIRKRTLTEGRAPKPKKRPLISAATYSVNSGTMDDHHLYYKYNTYGSPSSSITGRVVAETNDDYRYLADTAGAFCFYPNYTGTIMNDVGKVFEAYKRALPTKRLIHGQQGFLHARDEPHKRHIEPWTLSQKFKTASANTDGFIVWNLPCEQVSSSHLHPNNRAYGIFSERAGAGSGYDCRAHFSRKNAARYGHYQRFVTNYPMPAGSTLSYRLKTNGGGFDYFRARVFPSASHSATGNDDLAMISKFVFDSNTPSDYGAGSGANYLKIFNSADRYNIWFNDGSGDSAPSATGTEIEIDISSTSSASGAIAHAFYTAMNNHSAFEAFIPEVTRGKERHAGTAVYVTSSVNKPRIRDTTEESSKVGTLSGISVSTQRSGNYDWYNQEVTGGYSSIPTEIFTQQISSSTKLGFEVRTGPIGYGDTFGIGWLSASINIGGNDMFLSRSSWSFESWYSGSSLQELYTDVTDFYGEVDSASAYHNMVIEMRSDGTWKITAPTHGDTIYVESDESTYVYDGKHLRWRKMASTISDLIVETSFLSKVPLLREGLCAARRDAAYEIEFESDLKSSSIPLDVPVEIDSEYYAHGSDYIRIKKPGTYRLDYRINFKNLGSKAPTGSITTYVATSSQLSGTSTPWPPFILAGTTGHIHLMGISGSETMGGAHDTSLQVLKAGDELRLYAERAILTHYSDVPATVSTEQEAVTIVLEKVK